MKLRKTICTASLFVVLMAAVISLFVFRGPARWAYWWDGHPELGNTLWITILVDGVIGPLFAGAAGVGFVASTAYGLWQVAYTICAKLRGAEPGEQK
jgi:hypothetical protein